MQPVRPALGAARATVLVPLAAALLCAFAPSALADDASEVAKLRAELDAERAARLAMEQRVRALEQSPSAPTTDQIASQVERYLGEKSLFDAALPSASLGGGAGSLLDVSVILTAHFGTSTATNAALPAIDLGDHDPRVRGANVRNEEVVVSADVDPYFYGFFDVVYKIDEEGESQFELEEAYGLTTSLPCGLQWKFGQFFTEFGRVNALHPHAWEFHDYPVAWGRIFGGDGFRGQGMRLSWRVPTCGRCPVTLLAGWQNARGETQASFIAEEGEEIGEHELFERDVANLSDLTYHARAEVSCDAEGPCDSTISWLAGVSGAIGPNSTGPDGYTGVLGADFFLKWQPRATDGGWPWVTWQTEVLYREYHADDQVRSVDDGLGGFVDVPVASHRYVDWGVYSQVVWGFSRPWSIGGRVDYASTDGAFDGDHWRGSVAVTYYPSEFSRLRFQAQYDDVERLSAAVPGDDDENWSIWLGVELTLGKHGAHKF